MAAVFPTPSPDSTADGHANRSITVKQHACPGRQRDAIGSPWRSCQEPSTPSIVSSCMKTKLDSNPARESCRMKKASSATIDDSNTCRITAIVTRLAVNAHSVRARGVGGSEGAKVPAQILIADLISGNSLRDDSGGLVRRTISSLMVASDGFEVLNSRPTTFRLSFGNAFQITADSRRGLRMHCRMQAPYG